tara:strand:+ start:18 stop:1004 length:987 start_codon:yes stop_codon:yes gene_type:complete
MLKEWGWNAEKLERLNDYPNWQMMHKVDLGNRINKILMASYKNISEKNKTLDPSESLITEKDTALLGRKLFSFYRPAPNKVDNLGALVDGKTAEMELTILLEQKSPRDKPKWYLIRGKTIAPLEKIEDDNIIRKSNTLPFLLAFTVFNNLYNEDTQITLRADGGSMKDVDIEVLLGQLRQFIASINIAALSNEDLLDKAKVNELFMLIDFGTPPPPEVMMENIKDCKNSGELKKFITLRTDKIKSITTTYVTSWGELFCKTYSGINCMTRCIRELAPQLAPEKVNKSNFLKVYIPNGRKELLKIAWFNNYIIRSLLIKANALPEKVAS